ncbi:MAG: hypothetical protein NZ700_17625 [Gemmataceae bacterium]|nr:hypothetical protein [Gemmataceae bacterium]MDW8266308.1 hypothetical protein [Gemmataceae bacterium]
MTQARVQSIEALRDFRNVLTQCGEDWQDALAAVEAVIRRTFDWLNDQLKWWQRELREREEEVVQRKAELFRKQMPNALGHIPDCTVEIKALNRAKQAVEEAEEKIKTIRRWGGHLWPHAVTEYEGTARVLANMLTDEFPKTLALLDRMIAALDAYVGLAPVASAPAEAEVPKEKTAP